MIAPSKTQERPPIVAVLGHVDHGKSTLLDYIRKANTVAKEAGGITQHVAAYEVEHEKGDIKKRITFIDTPGHAAFQAIRARGASIADIAILVVAADDGVKAQTLEALESIKASGIPFVVAINKIDKPNADLSRTQGSLLEHHVFLEKMGGDVPWVPVSAKTGTGIDELLDLVLLVAELEELKAEKDVAARGFVVEAHRDEKRGIAATLIITAGELAAGMAVRAGRAIAPVRIMNSHTGRPLKKATFSTPVTLYGFDELPEVGAEFVTYKDKKSAEADRPEIARLENVLESEESEERYYLPLIIRADVTGSLEGIMHELKKVGDEYSGVRIALSGIGNVSEADVKAAISGATPAVILGFNVGTDALARESARQHEIHIEHFNIIYKLIERVQELLEEKRPRRKVEEELGTAKIIKTFSTRKDKHVVGGTVKTGRIEKKAHVRIKRRQEVVGEGVILSLQSNRQTVERIETDGDFGAEIESDVEILEHDIIVCFRTETV